MRYFLFPFLFMATSIVYGQKAILVNVLGQESSIDISRHEVKSGQLFLFDAKGKKILIPSNEGNKITLSDGLQFGYFNYSLSKTAKSGYFQQLTAGVLAAYDFGGAGLLVRDPKGGDFRLIPLSDNKPVLTYLLRECSAITAEYLEKVNTDGLTRLLDHLHEYNNCIDGGSAELLLIKKLYATKLTVGPVLGVKFSTLNSLDREDTFREAQGSHVGPTIGLEVRKKIGRSPISLRGQALISQLNIKNDSLHIAFNNSTYEKYEIKSLNLQFNILGAFQLREEGFFASLIGGFSPRLNLNFDLSREVFGDVRLINEYSGRKAFGVGIVGGIGLYERKLRSGQQLSIQLHADTYKQYINLSDGTTPGYRELKWSLLVGCLF